MLNKSKVGTPALTSGFSGKFCPKSKRSTPALTLEGGKQIWLKSKRSQEEMLGFVLIIIIVAVIMLVFLGFYLRDSPKEIVESYEVESFIQAFLQHTTDCRDNLEYLSIRKLIFDCNEGGTCLDGRDTCEVLDSTLTNLVEESWKVGSDTPIKGYELNITSNKEEMLLIKKGNKTNNYRGTMQDFSRSGNLFEILFTAYY